MLSESIYQAWYTSNTEQEITAMKAESVQWLALTCLVGCCSTAAQPGWILYMRSLIPRPSHPSLLSLAASTQCLSLAVVLQEMKRWGEKAWVRG